MASASPSWDPLPARYPARLPALLRLVVWLWSDCTSGCQPFIANSRPPMVLAVLPASSASPTDTNSDHRCSPPPTASWPRPAEHAGGADKPPLRSLRFTFTWRKLVLRSPYPNWGRQHHDKPRAHRGAGGDKPPHQPDPEQAAGHLAGQMTPLAGACPAIAPRAARSS